MSNIDSTSSELDYTIQKWEKAGHIPSLMSAVVNYWLINRCCGVIYGGCAVNWNLKTPAELIGDPVSGVVSGMCDLTNQNRMGLSGEGP